MITEKNRFGQFYGAQYDANVGWTGTRGGQTMNNTEPQQAALTVEEMRAACKGLEGLYTIDIYPNNAALKAYLGKEVRVILPDVLTKITNTAFRNSPQITSIYIPRSIVSIDVTAFAECHNLVELVVDKANPRFSSKDGILYNKEGTALVYYPGLKAGDDFTISDEVEKIEPFAFSTCKSLKLIRMPMLMDRVGANAFSGCQSVREIVVSPNITTIEERAFHNCGNLSVVDIPDSVKTIGADAFYRCAKLKSIFIPASVKSIASHPFALCDKGMIIACEDAKPNPNWSPDFASKEGHGTATYKVQYGKGQKR